MPITSDFRCIARIRPRQLLASASLVRKAWRAPSKSRATRGKCLHANQHVRRGRFWVDLFVFLHAGSVCGGGVFLFGFDAHTSPKGTKLKPPSMFRRGAATSNKYCFYYSSFLLLLVRHLLLVARHLFLVASCYYSPSMFRRGCQCCYWLSRFATGSRKTAGVRGPSCIHPRCSSRRRSVKLEP